MESSYRPIVDRINFSGAGKSDPVAIGGPRDLHSHSVGAQRSPQFLQADCVETEQYITCEIIDFENSSSYIDAHMATTPEFKIISSLTSSGASAESAVRGLLVLTAAASKESPNDDGDGALSVHICNVWSALVEDVVANTDSAQQYELVEFVRELRLQEMVDPATNSPLLYNLVADQYIPVWTGLPLFGISVRDEWNFDANSYTSREEVCYYNKLTFLAKLTNTPENNVSGAELELPPYDFSLYALWDFRAIFEEESVSEAARKILLRAASLWMIHCADRLWANVQAGRSFVHHASGTNPAFAGQKFDREYRTWTGFNQERWEIWVREFEHVDETEDEDMTALIGKALIEIARVERAH